MSEVETNTEQEQRPSLTLHDLNLMLQLIESGFERKAFKIDEMSTVGGLYDRISLFLNAATAAQKAQAQANETDAASDNEGN